MRKVREITAEEENFRVEPARSRIGFIKRDPVEPEPVGTIVLMAFRVTGYHPDCDGSLLACVARIDTDGETTGWCEDAIGIYPETDLVVSLEEWREMHAQAAKQHPEFDTEDRKDLV